MAERKSLDGLTLTRQRDVTVMALGSMEIWDGADLALLRDGLTHLIMQRGDRSIAVDMSAVKYVPSGFFGLLFDWYDQGVSIRLHSPQQRVQNMLWFRQFFHHEMEGWYLLHDAVNVNPPAEEAETETDDWQEQPWESHIEDDTPVPAHR